MFFNVKHLRISLIFSTFVHMKREDNILILNRHLLSELIRMSNLFASKDEYIRFLENENKTIENETRAECLQSLELIKADRDNAYRGKAEETRRADVEKARADRAEAIIAELKATIGNLNARVSELNAKVDELRSANKEISDISEKSGMDYKDIVNVLRRRIYQRNSDATRLLDGEIDPNDPYLEEMGLQDVIKRVMELTSDGKEDKRKSVAEESVKTDLPSAKSKKRQHRETSVFSPRKRIYSATDLKRIGLDTSNLPKDAKIIRRKSKNTGVDVWYLRLIYYIKGKTVSREYAIGRFNVPNADPMSSCHPCTIVGNNPIMPSFARFYLDSKFNLCLSEGRIISVLKSLRTKIPQASLNLWMHQIMSVLMERLEPLMLEAMRLSKFTNNDGTRILVRSREADDKPFKYKIEYIQAALSLEKKLCVMLYDEGTRGHELQEEKIFKDSTIECFVADRAPQYVEIVTDLEKQKKLKRQACWFHGRHYLCDAYIVDKRVRPIIQLINTLFYIERMFKLEEDQSPEARYRFRMKWSLTIVNKIMKMLKAIRAAGDEYGQMVQRAVNYILDDEEAFRKFLSDGRVDMHNNAIERCFRHIALGRRNWLQSGSHDAAKNIAFMFGLLESCKLNDVSFGEYIEDVLTRIMYGEQVDASFLPCDYVRKYEDGQDDKDAEERYMNLEIKEENVA